jgi:transposase
MTCCPNCGSHKVEEDTYNPATYHDGYGEQIITRYFECLECGCQWKEITTITTEIEILAPL